MENSKVEGVWLEIFTSVTCGVPQGSILGPLLFLIAFNNVGESLQHCKIVMYADDTVIFTPGKSKAELEKKLKADFALALPTGRSQTN